MKSDFKEKLFQFNNVRISSKSQKKEDGEKKKRIEKVLHARFC